MFEMILGIGGMTLWYGLLLFLITNIFLILVEKWIQYITDDKNFKINHFGRNFLDRQYNDPSDEGGYLVLLMCIYAIYLSWLVFLTFIFISESSEDFYAAIVMPYNYLGEFSLLVFSGFIFMRFTKFLKDIYPKYKKISDNIDKLK